MNLVKRKVSSSRDEKERENKMAIKIETVEVPGLDVRFGKYPVTQAQWKAVMKTNPSKFKGADRPVDSVTWYDAWRFINALSQVTGKKYRLPRSEEWVQACLGDPDEEGYGPVEGNNDPDLDEIAWHKGNAGGKTHPVGQKKPNIHGLYDMHGNVNEWCWDAYDDDGEVGVGGPQEPAFAAGGLGYAYMGGSWNDANCWCSRGGTMNPDAKSPEFGLRIVEEI